MEWTKIEDGLPECWSQHGNAYASGFVLTYDSAGEYEIGQYWKTPDGNHWEGFEDKENYPEMYVTHWAKLISPNK